MVFFIKTVRDPSAVVVLFPKINWPAEDGLESRKRRHVNQ